MTPVSKFSTQANLVRVNSALDQLAEAEREGELAVQAGVPGAQAALDGIKSKLSDLQKFKAVYFPGGVATA